MDQQTFGNPASGAGAPKSSGGMPKWAWITLIVVVLGGALCCGLSCFGINFAMGEIGKVIGTELSSHEVVQEELGNISNASFSWSETISEQQGTGNSDSLVFEVQGDKGSGLIVVEMNQGAQDPSAMLRRATLVIGDERIELIE